MGRAVVVITEKCNFRCPYCRTFDGDQMHGSMVNELINNYFRKQNLFAILFTGGEPTVHPEVVGFVTEAHNSGIPNIGLATNGSAPLNLYNDLYRAGVNDFSISLDADNPADGAAMSGGRESSWQRIISNIREIASWCRVTIGLVVNERNVHRLPGIIEFAQELGVYDIRVNPAAQFSNRLPESVLSGIESSDYPILDWRIRNRINNIDVRGIDRRNAVRHCWLVQDETVINGNLHYPCFVYMREGGAPIGKVNSRMRDDRRTWMLNHDPYNDPICRANCADCCLAFNQRYEDFHSEDVSTTSTGSISLKTDLIEVPV